MARQVPEQTVETRIRRLMRRITEVDTALRHGSAVADGDLRDLFQEARTTLRESEDRFHRLTHGTGVVVAEIGGDGQLRFVNDAVTGVTGYRPAELLGSEWIARLFPDELRREVRRLFRQVARRDVSRYELSLRNRHRGKVTVQVDTANRYGAAHHLESVLLTAVDVSARKRLEAELEQTRRELDEKVWERTDQLERINAELQIEIIEREQFERALATSEERFRRAVDNIPAALAIYDPERRIQFVNARALALWQLPEREVLGSRDEELFPAAVTEHYLPALQRAIRFQRPQSVEAAVELNGRGYTLVLTYVPLTDQSGALEEVLGIAYDITEQRRTEEDLRSRHADLLTLSQVSELALTRRSLSEAYASIARNLTESGRFPIALIQTYDAERGLLLLQAVSGLAAGSLEAERPLAGTPEAAVLTGNHPVVLHDGENPGVELHTVVHTPLATGEQVLGVLTVAHPRFAPVDDRTLQLLSSVANYVAVMTDRQRAEDALRESEAQRERAEAFSLIMVTRLSLAGNWLKVPPTLCRLLAYSEAELLAMRIHDLVEPDDRTALEAALARLLRGEQSVELELRCLTRHEQTVWLDTALSVIADTGGKPLHLLAYLRDTTERRHAEEELRLAANVFDSSAEAIIILDRYRHIVKVNTAFTEITGYPTEEAAARTLHFLDSGLHDVELYRKLWLTVAQQGRWQGELWGRRRDATLFPALLNVGAVLDDAGQLTNFVVIFRDISDLKESQRQLERLANYDNLTALPNRNLFYDRLRHGLERAQRNVRRLAVMFVDLDNFKLINDSFGHDAGDQFLRDVAGRLRRCIRSEDTVARLGGDEFVVLLEEIEDIAHVAETARRIHETLFIPTDLAGQKVDITGSIGISVYPDDGTELGVLLRNADRAMYVAKELGRNNYQFFTSGMNEKVVERLDMESALRRALERDEFFLVYQPQIEVASGATIGVESAIRWHHPEWGTVYPGRFIPVAEQTGLIDAIGRWVLQQVCDQIRAWNAAGMPRRRVAVNLSPRQFRQRHAVDAIKGIVSDAGIDPADLELELTEPVLMDDPEKAIGILKSLKAFGLHIAVDNFGTGYSSLNYLKRFPLDRLKIDMSFVQDLTTDADDRAISTAIIGLAHSLDIGVIAEGVETRDQYDFLAAHGCDAVQGFYFSGPLLPEEVARSYR